MLILRLITARRKQEFPHEKDTSVWAYTFGGLSQKRGQFLIRQVHVVKVNQIRSYRIRLLSNARSITKKLTFQKSVISLKTITIYRWEKAKYCDRIILVWRTRLYQNSPKAAFFDENFVIRKLSM